MLNSDKPINRLKEDQFDRLFFSRDLGKAIINLANKDSFCIGLIGGWGSGKTSLINMTLDYIDKATFVSNKTPIVFRFNPWCFQNENQLFNQFFLQLVSLLRGNDVFARVSCPKPAPVDCP